MKRAIVPLLVIAALVGIAAILLFLTRGDDSEPASVTFPTISNLRATARLRATPVPTPTVPTTATAEPLPTIQPTTGTLVYLRGDDLWVASLDSVSLPPRAIAQGAVRSGYAGYVRRTDAGIDLYYVSQLSEQSPPEQRYVAEFGLYRANLTGGESEELLRYSSRPLEYGTPSNASVSPDGRYAVYADVDGLVLLDLTTKDARSLLTNGPCTAATVDCWRYGRPEWSPSGDVVKVVKGLYESAVAVLLRPFESPPGVVELEDGGYNGQLSPDDGRFCYLEGLHGFTGRLVVIDPSSGERHLAEVSVDSRAKSESALSSEPYAYDCAWSADGRVAAAVVEAEVGGNLTWLVFLDNDLGLIAEGPTIPGLSTLVAWLPDDSGVLYNGYRSPPGVLDLEAGLFRLPFAADQALAVIP